VCYQKALGKVKEKATTWTELAIAGLADIDSGKWAFEIAFEKMKGQNEPTISERLEPTSDQQPDRI
jgi:hypothetical protein